jgi:hypothetical protein
MKGGPGVRHPRREDARKMRGASLRARAIAEGLVQTGRAYDPRTVGTHIRLRARVGRFYWVAIDGSELLRGDALDMAEELQQSFADAMAKAGGSLV